MDDKHRLIHLFLSGKVNPVRNDPRKQHNDLIDFEDLDQNTKNYDINQVKEQKEVWEL
jgi:hypothetical protein